MNPVEIEEAVSNLALEPFDSAEFPFQFLAAFDNPATTIKRLRSGTTNQSDIKGGVLQRNNIHIATCAPGGVDATLKALRESPKTASAKAKFILATDGETFQAEDMNGGGTVACSYAEFPDHFGFFLPLAGITTVKEIRESSFDVKATGRLNRLYIQLLKENPDWATAERQRDMNHFMARLIFCFFAEDTDIFLSEGLFTKTVEQMSAGDAASTHSVIGEIFRAMDTKPADREGASLPRYAVKFPYVNGQLFSGSTDVPRFSKVARSYLMHIGSLNWRKINPDIFGSMIQAVTDDAERGSLGMHYTSVPNILKVLNPLFLDSLREQLEEAGTNARKLLNLRNRMARIRVFDPACGSGNFLVIAYKEMRAVEAEINKRRGEPDRRSDIPLTNFRGIELRDFPAEIARLALIIAEYQCDVLYRGQKEAIAEFLPLGSENWITCGNALRMDWMSLCPPERTSVKLVGDDLFQTPLEQSEIAFDQPGGETYICGNPPYLGKGKKTNEHQEDLDRLFAGRMDGWGYVDYVGGFLLLAADYVRASNAMAALVMTNTVCQGLQLPQMWPTILKDGVQISFARRSFKWSNNAARNAGVTVVIVGLAGPQFNRPKVLFEDDRAKVVQHINAYLLDGEDVYVTRQTHSVNRDFPVLSTGSVPNDGGHLTMSRADRDKLVAECPESISFVRKFVGGAEFTQGLERYCLSISDDDLERALQSDEISRRLDAVRRHRLQSTKKEAREELSKKPHRFQHVAGTSARDIIVVAAITSENRDYLPAGLLPGGTIVNNKAFVAYEAPKWLLSLVVSRLHWVWIGTVCARLEMRFSYSNTLGWNTFPIPKLTAQNKDDLTRCAENILLAREAHFPATIADLYDPETMPEDLRRAHEANDEMLERIYIGRRFRNDTERLEKLFELYTKMTSRKAAA